jgi:hypothetical protein
VDVFDSYTGVTATAAFGLLAFSRRRRGRSLPVD